MLCALADFVEAASLHKFEVIEPQRFSTHTITKTLYVSPKSDRTRDHASCAFLLKLISGTAADDLRELLSPKLPTSTSYVRRRRDFGCFTGAAKVPKGDSHGVKSRARWRDGLVDVRVGYIKPPKLERNPSLIQLQGLDNYEKRNDGFAMSCFRSAKSHNAEKHDLPLFLSPSQTRRRSHHGYVSWSGQQIAKRCY